MKPIGNNEKKIGSAGNIRNISENLSGDVQNINVISDEIIHGSVGRKPG